MQPWNQILFRSSQQKNPYSHGSSNHRKPPQRVLGGSCSLAFSCLLFKRSSGYKGSVPVVPPGAAGEPSCPLRRPSSGMCRGSWFFSRTRVGKKMLSEASSDAVKSQSHLFTLCQLTNARLILKYPRHESELAPRVQFFFLSIAS